MATVAPVLAPPDIRPATSLEGRIVAAALRCIRQWGLAKTTLDDVARQADCSRATLYRVFPGGKDALLQAVAQSEITRVSRAVTCELDAAGSLGEALAQAMAVAAGLIADHGALQFLLAHEPETVMPWLAFRHGEELLAFSSTVAAPHLARWLSPGEARRAGEWAVRIILSFCFCPSPGVDLTDLATARRVVATFMLPGLQPDR
ncbi:MAG: hypothetical protein QOK39_1395 [Acidimicrobiaceae bacterium]|nr:hypothetical protein [Acidimicrobiaceae bacterium]